MSPELHRAASNLAYQTRMLILRSKRLQIDAQRACMKAHAVRFYVACARRLRPLGTD